MDTAKFNLYKHDDNSLRGCVLEVDLEYLQELHEFDSLCFSPPNKLEIKKEMLYDYQLKINDDYNIFISNVKKLAPNFFDKESYVLH